MQFFDISAEATSYKHAALVPRCQKLCRSPKVHLLLLVTKAFAIASNANLPSIKSGSLLPQLLQSDSCVALGMRQNRAGTHLWCSLPDAKSTLPVPIHLG